jgi:hypothetical protein
MPMPCSEVEGLLRTGFPATSSVPSPPG